MSQTNKNSPRSDWYQDGIKFECQGSGKCCVSHGEYGFVYVTSNDRKQMAKLLGIATAQFTRKYCEKSDGLFRLKDGSSTDPNDPEAKPCIFLKKKRCTIYEARPTQCRTWPFWPETMSAKSWAKDVAAFCPGVGKGRVWTQSEIEDTLRDQRSWETQIALSK
jgi:Fe-S-cluster containining protein